MLVQQHTLYENFSKTIAIESACLLDMATSYILPAAFEFRSKLAQSIDIKCPRQVAHLESVSKLISDLLGALENHKIAQEKAKEIDAEEHPHEQATLYRTEVFDCMGVTRHLCDSLEKVVDDKLWPFPKYSEILFMK
jgi:glutamine synthetase